MSTWRPKRYPITCGTSASQLIRLVEVRHRERVFKGILGIVLVLYFVILGIVAILR